MLVFQSRSASAIKLMPSRCFGHIGSQSFICRGEMDMSFVIAVPDVVEAAAQDLAGIRSALDEVTQAIVAPTTGLVPAANDEVSTAIASLFGNFGQEYQALNAEVGAFHNAFVTTLSGGAAAYLETELSTVGTLLSGGGSGLVNLGGGVAGAAQATSALGINLSGGLGVGLSAALGPIGAELEGLAL